MIPSRCDCLICRLEKSLLVELRDEQSCEEFRSFATPHALLASFPTAFDLIERLHRQEDLEQNRRSDEILLELLDRGRREMSEELFQRLLLLVFIPTVHRTTSQVTASFPSLLRDDIAQHIIAIFLAFLRSGELRARRSHIAFTVARKVRRSAFRWAIRESRRALSEDPHRDVAPAGRLQAGQMFSDSNLLLEQFLTSCQQRGWLSGEERSLLAQFKLEGFSGEELARQNGHSAVAIRHRLQRVIARLRRIALAPNQNDQLNLFTL